MSPATEIEIRLQPRAGQNRIAGERDGRLLVQVTAPPVEDRANEALCRLVAKRARVARGKVSIVRGMRSRDKLVRVEGVGESELRRALAT